MPGVAELQKPVPVQPTGYQRREGVGGGTFMEQAVGTFDDLLQR